MYVGCIVILVCGLVLQINDPDPYIWMASRSRVTLIVYFEFSLTINSSSKKTYDILYRVIQNSKLPSFCSGVTRISCARGPTNEVRLPPPPPPPPPGRATDVVRAMNTEIM